MCTACGRVKSFMGVNKTQNFSLICWLRTQRKRREKLEMKPPKCAETQLLCPLAPGPGSQTSHARSRQRGMDIKLANLDHTLKVTLITHQSVFVKKASEGTVKSEDHKFENEKNQGC